MLKKYLRKMLFSDWWYTNKAVHVLDRSNLRERCKFAAERCCLSLRTDTGGGSVNCATHIFR